MPKYFRQKGKSFEREIASLMTNLVGVKYIRTPLSGGLRSTFDGDLMKHPKESYKATILNNCILECKFQKKLNVGQWIDKVKEEAKDGDKKYWLLFFKRMGEIIVVMPLDYFENLIKIILKEFNI